MKLILKPIHIVIGCNTTLTTFRTMKPFQYFVPSLVELIITNPLDVYITRIQANKPFHYMNHSFRGLGYRTLSFLPVRTSFWWAQHNSPSEIIWKKALFVTSVKSLFDIPFDYLKTRRMNSVKTPIYIPLALKSATAHFTRNYLFCFGLLSTKLFTNQYPYFKHKPLIGDLLGTLVGSTIGAIISQPFDVMKTRYATNYSQWITSFVGLFPRIAKVGIGLGVGQVTLNILI